MSLFAAGHLRTSVSSVHLHLNQRQSDHVRTTLDYIDEPEHFRNSLHKHSRSRMFPNRAETTLQIQQNSRTYNVTALDGLDASAVSMSKSTQKTALSEMIRK